MRSVYQALSPLIERRLPQDRSRDWVGSIAVLTANGLIKRFGDRVLFQDVALQLRPGRRQALVGGNGTGKTTLIEILVGIQQQDAGEVSRPRDTRVGYLAQELPGAQGGPVIDEVLGGAGSIRELAQEIHRLEHLVAATSGPEHDKALSKLGTAQTSFEQQGGYAVEAEAHRILAGLGFAASDHDRPVTELSGGWRMRVALARLLLSDPEVLILDEPTNHLDVDSVAWLEQYLSAWNGALLFVSHDRDFIDAVANRVLELVPGEGIVEYTGNFAEFVEQREERIAMAEAAAANQARKVAQVERFVERFRYKATKARQVQSRVKMLDRLDTVKVPERAVLRTKFGFPEPRRSSRVVVEVDGVSVGYDDTTIIADTTFVLERGTKVALVGPNGAGKTTLVRLILGELAPTKGTVTMGANVDYAVFHQDQTAVLDSSRTVFEEFRIHAGDRPGRNLRTVLGSFGFTGDAADRFVGDLSGGERTRLALGKTMVDPVNLLVLDEPTNHLDLPSCDILEEALLAYPGTVILVTHDRYLIRSVADALIEVRDGKARWHDGVDEALLAPPGLNRPSAAVSAPPKTPANKTPANKTPANKTPANKIPVNKLPSKPADRKGGGQARAAQPPPPAAVAREQAKSQQRDTRRLRKALDTAEKSWERAEAEVAEWQQQMADPALYADQAKVQAATRSYEAAKDRAAQAMAAWEAATLELERA